MNTLGALRPRAPRAAVEKLSTAMRRTLIHSSMSEEEKRRYLESHPFERARLERAFLKRARKWKARHAAGS